MKYVVLWLSIIKNSSISNFDILENYSTKIKSKDIEQNLIQLTIIL